MRLQQVQYHVVVVYIAMHWAICFIILTGLTRLDP